MELIKGVNCYTDVAEADEIISNTFMSTEPEKVYWDSLSDNDKSILIYRVTEKYDTDEMMYIGCKQSESQKMQFPRIDNFSNYIEVPYRIKLGLLIQVIRSSMSVSNEEEKLRDSGVKSFADGSGARIEFSESYNNIYCKCTNGLYRSVYNTYFKPYTIMI